MDNSTTPQKITQFNQKASASANQAQAISTSTPAQTHALPKNTQNATNQPQPAIAPDLTKNATGQTTSNKDKIAQKAAQTPEQQKEEADALAQQKADEEKQKQQEDLLLKAGQKIGEGQEAIANAANPFMQWLAKQPTPGGVATIFFILVFFMFVIYPVNKNGDTRLKLLWLTLTGKTHLDYEVAGGAAKNLTQSNNTLTPVTPTPTQTLSTTPNAPVTQPVQTLSLNGNTPTIDVFSLLGFSE